MSTIKGLDTIEQLRRLYPNAEIVDTTHPRTERKQREPRPKEFVEPGVSLEAGRLIILVPTETKSESNMRGWQGKARRSKSAKLILFQLLGPLHAMLTSLVVALHAGKGLQVTFTRLGGRELDDDNLRASMKASRDAAAAALLVDDRDPGVHWCYEQETGGAVGVRIEIEEFE